MRRRNSMSQNVSQMQRIPRDMHACGMPHSSAHNSPWSGNHVYAPSTAGTDRHKYMR